MHPSVKYAKDVIESIFSGAKVKAPAGLDERSGCFVTLHRHGDLRGCIGYITSEKPLHQTLHDAAVSAALHDPRFPALRRQELADIEVEVSVLSRPKAVQGDARDRLAAFSPGKTGLIVQRGMASGLLLPQVFDQDTSAEEAFGMTCRKAGLPPHTWRDPATTVYTFTATVHKE